MTKPRLSKSDALQFIGPIAAREVVAIGIRGYYYKDSSQNQRGTYDDAICIVGPEHFSAYNANVDPSVFRPGIATLKPGVYPFKPGKRLTGRSKGSPVFRPATKNEELPVYRDGESNPSPGLAILFHPGGYNTTSSLGCQTLYPDQWDAFYATMMDQLKRAGQKTFNYHLVYPV